MSTLKRIKVSNSTYDVGVHQSEIDWGGYNKAGSVSPIGAAMSSMHSANRIAFLNPDAINIEYSKDAGSTWTSYGADDAAKTRLVTFDDQVSFNLGKTGDASTNNKLRITLTATTTSIQYFYTSAVKLLINVSTAAHGMNVLIERKDGASGSSWVSMGTYNLTGWSGWNDIPLQTVIGGGSNQTSQPWQLRFTFNCTSVNNTYKSSLPNVLSLKLFGITNWWGASTLASTGNLYWYDYQQNATFPKEVTATKFNGNATGLVDSGNGNTITANYSASGMAYGSVSWLAAWNGYSLQSISKNEFVGNNADSVSTALNKLNSGNATPSGTDYYICQSAGGGTTDTTYYRRPVSALWNYIKGQADNVYVAKGTIATTSAAGLMSSEDKSKLDGIAAGANNYSLPNASSSTLGGVKIGDNITCSLGTISLTKANVTTALGYTPPTTNSTYTIATKTAAGLVKPISVISKPSIIHTDTTGSYYAVEMSSDGSMFVNVPSKTYSAAAGIMISASGSISNSGVRSVSTGSTNGTISVNTNGTTSNVSVKGLGSAAYTSSSNYATSGHTHSTFNNNVTIGTDYYLDVRSIKTYDSWLGSTTSTGSYGNVLKCGSNGRLYWGTDNTGTDYKASSSNSSETLYLVGVTAQSTSATEGKQTYSNSLCYASGGYLYSNGKKVDMDSISGGVEWGTF